MGGAHANMQILRGRVALFLDNFLDMLQDGTSVSPFHVVCLGVSPSLLCALLMQIFPFPLFRRRPRRRQASQFRVRPSDAIVYSRNSILERNSATVNNCKNVLRSFWALFHEAFHHLLCFFVAPLRTIRGWAL